MNTVLFLYAGALAGCDENIVDLSYNGMEFFERSQITVSAQPGCAVADQSVILTTRCMPHVTGKGLIMIDGHANSRDGLWILERPWLDTISWAKNSDPVNDRSIRVEFTAGKEFVQHWQVRPTESKLHSFTFRVVLDLIYIADSNKYYRPGSDVIRKLYPRGFKDLASSASFYLRP